MSQNLVSAPQRGFAVAVASVGIPTLVMLAVAIILNWGR